MNSATASDTTGHPPGIDHRACPPSAWAAVWAWVAKQSAEWLASPAVGRGEGQTPGQGSRPFSTADVTVLLPFSQLAQQARVAWVVAQPSGFLPAFETPESWAARLAPVGAEGTAPDTADVRADLLIAQQVLTTAQHAALRERPRLHAQTLVGLVHELREAMSQLPPVDRAAWWRQVALSVDAGSGLGGKAGGADDLAVNALDQALLGLALTWAQQGDTDADDAAPQHPLDVLWHQKPSAVVAVLAGASPRLVSLCRHWAAKGVPVLLLSVDARTEFLTLPAADAADLPELAELQQHLRFVRTADVEDEAWQTACTVLAQLSARPTADARPVALVAQDRVVVRRVRALLARQAVRLQDETGWTLSTTRAAATVLGALRAIAPQVDADEVLGWLRSWPQATQLPGLDELEARLRQLQVTDWQATQGLHTTHRLLGLLAAGLEPLQALAQQAKPFVKGHSRQPSLAQWWHALGDTLRTLGLWPSLEQDAAGAQVLQALALTTTDGPPADLADLASGMPMDLFGFTQWVSDTLEQSSFQPALQPSADVVVTPLARARLRDFSAVVVPGCDAAHLGVPPAWPGGWTQAQRQALGLEHLAAWHERQEQHWALVLLAARCCPVTVLVRQLQDGEPVNPAALVLRAQHRLGMGWAGVPDAVADASREWPLTSPTMPAPIAAQLLPNQLSASAYADLRACPYRFFALRMLPLSRDDELDDSLDKRDMGVWLHEVLRRFHEQRLALATQASSPGGDDAALLNACAEAAAQGLDASQSLPFMANWPALAKAYLVWLQGHEQRTGARFVQAEQREQVALEGAQPPLVLRGQIDRVDQTPQGECVLDYKTGSRDTLKSTLNQPGEEVQLAFYGLLRPAASSAVYLSFDDRTCESLPLSDLPAVAAQLAEGLRDDWKRISTGAPLPAFGEAPACDHCAAVGLCRKPHWSAT